MMDWGVETLDLSWCWPGGELPGPVRAWGAGRKGEPVGTLQFYVDDYRYGRAAKRPISVAATGCLCCTELNFSTGPEMARWEVLNLVGRKRRIASVWGRAGLKLLVDLHMYGDFDDLSLLGVPDGWTAYSARWQPSVSLGMDHLDRCAGLAADRAGRTPYFAVFGGGKRVKLECIDKGWWWYPDHNGTWNQDLRNKVIQRAKAKEAKVAS